MWNKFVGFIEDVFFYGKMKKLFIFLSKHWFKFVLVWLAYVCYSTFTDPAALEAAKARMLNPWYYGMFGSIVVFWFAFAIWWRLKSRKEWKKINAYLESVKKGLLKSVEENKLMAENEIPDAESISKYYKMYLKKYELDHADQFTTIEPMSFEKWEEQAIDDPGEWKQVRWKFMVAMTSDMFMFDPNGKSTMMRFRDYEALI